MPRFLAIFSRFLMLLALSSMMTIMLNPNLINLDQYVFNQRVVFNKTAGDENGPTERNLKNLSRVQSMECKLPDLDPWSEKALPFIDKSNNKMFGCQVQYKTRSFMRNGRVVLYDDEVKSGTECRFSCMYLENDYNFTQGDWLPISVVADCDVLEVNCSRRDDPFFKYNVIHTQVYRKDSPHESQTASQSQLNFATTTPPDKLDLQRLHSGSSPNYSNPRPDVHIIVFDSVASTQFMRSMSATLNLLRHDYDARLFPHLNKVGINSMPNAHALLFGHQVYEMDESPVNDRFPPKYNASEVCNKRYLDDDQFIGYEFKKNGYKTMFAEDWDMGVFNWLNCKGFERPPVDHYMRPFQLRLESMRSQGFNSTFRRRMYDEMCREPHEYQMDYFLDFINAYPDKPKFSINWFAYLAHDDTNALFHVDMYFQRFLRENKEKLSNSYLIVMGDHGNRYDKIRDTKLGEAEEKNPLLMVVVPRHLRANQQLWSNMKKNSKQLTTHYDTYATLVDIAHNSPFYNSNSSFDGFKKPNTGLEIIGESYLHAYKLDKPRNCNNQRIPFDFCSCQFQQQDRSGDKKFAEKIANFLVDWINGAVERHNQSSICARLGLHFETPIEVEEFEADQHFNAFKVTVRLSPGGGRVWAYVQAHGELNSPNVTFSLISERPARLDSYKESAYCCKDTYVKPFCFCKDMQSSGPQLVMTNFTLS